MTMLPSSSRFSPLSVVLYASLLSVACSSGESDEGPSTFGASFTTNDSVGDTVTDESTDSGTTSDTGSATRCPTGTSAPDRIIGIDADSSYMFDLPHMPRWPMLSP